jgi:predicted CoA-binding protein
MKTKYTLVLGASVNAARYSNMAIKNLIENKHNVIALGNKTGNVNTVKIETKKIQFDHIDTITLYINPAHQKEYYDYIFSLNPKRIIFNPGTENEVLMQLAQQKGIATIEACTLVLLNTQQY